MSSVSQVHRLQNASRIQRPQPRREQRQTPKQEIELLKGEVSQLTTLTFWQQRQLKDLETHHKTTLVATVVIGAAVAATAYYLGANPDIGKSISEPLTLFFGTTVPGLFNGIFTYVGTGAPVGGAPVGGAPVGGAPVGGAPVGGAPVGGAPVGGAPVGGTPVAGAPQPAATSNP